MLDAVGTTRYTYTSFGALASEDGPWNDDTVTYSYANQLRTGLSLQQPSASPLSIGYAYDQAKRLTTLTSWARAFNYSYDSTTKLHPNRIGLPNGAYITKHVRCGRRFLFMKLSRRAALIVSVALAPLLATILGKLASATETRRIASIVKVPPSARPDHDM